MTGKISKYIRKPTYVRKPRPISSLLRNYVKKSDAEKKYYQGQTLIQVNNATIAGWVPFTSIA